MLGRASSMMPVRAAQRATARAATRVQHRYASGHGPSYNEPSGTYSDITDTRLPVRRKAPGTKRVKDAWENIWYWGMYGGVAAFAVIMYFKPDRSVRAWAAPEAEKRLDASGLPWRYKPSPNSGYPNGIP